MKQIKSMLLQFLYPNQCPSCRTSLTATEFVCEACAEKMLLEQNAYCHRCGKIVCICKHKPLAYDKAVIACRYSDAMYAVLCLKQSQNTNFAYFSAQILAKRILHDADEQHLSLDYVMPVPMHPAKQKQRGYNQAALIAKEIADILNIAFQDTILFKQESKTEQHLLNAQERVQNVASFGIDDTISLQAKHILLCDDVLTTGNTMHRCAELLKQNGAASVTAAAACTAALC